MMSLMCVSFGCYPDCGGVLDSMSLDGMVLADQLRTESLKLFITDFLFGEPPEGIHANIFLFDYSILGRQCMMHGLIFQSPSTMGDIRSILLHHLFPVFALQTALIPKWGCCQAVVPKLHNLRVKKLPEGSSLPLTLCPE